MIITTYNKHPYLLLVPHLHLPLCHLTTHITIETLLPSLRNTWSYCIKILKGFKHLIRNKPFFSNTHPTLSNTWHEMIKYNMQVIAFDFDFIWFLDCFFSFHFSHLHLFGYKNSVGQISHFQRKTEWVRVVYTNPQLAALKQSKEPVVTLGCQFSKIMKPL